jgi:tRNA A-37 threonylcarbamoyl transferase component Bud32
MMPPWGRRGATAAQDAAEIPGYRVLEPVGQGGFSVVYRAHQVALDRIVALKLLTVDFIDEKVRKRFLREVRLTIRLSGHPHVVTVLDAGITRSGRPYIAMDYFERGSLQDRLDAQGALPVAEVVSIGVKVAGALHAAHGLGVLHRDVKPQNILVSRFGEPALADFGVAIAASSVNRTGRTDALSPYHAAPEVLEGAEPTPAADVYSLGSTLYELLAGRPAHRQDGGGIAPLLLRILHEPPPPFTRHDVPPALTAAVLRAMAKDPGDRFETAASLAAALGAVLGPVASPGTSPVPAPGPGPALAPAAGAREVVTVTGPPAPWPGAPGAPGAPYDPGATVLRPGRAADAMPGPANGGSRLRRYGVIGTVIGMAVVGLACVLALRLLSPRTHATPAGASASPVPAAVLAAAKPTALSVTDDGRSVKLHWKIGPGSGYPMFVQVKPIPAGHSLQSAGTGATAAIVTGLNPGTGYCFEVAAVVSFGNPSVVAWSTPSCIRGAVAATPGG